MAVCGGMCAEGSGAQGRNRTTDTRIFSPLLYRLSYLGIRYSLKNSLPGIFHHRKTKAWFCFAHEFNGLLQLRSVAPYRCGRASKTLAFTHRIRRHILVPQGSSDLIRASLDFLHAISLARKLWPPPTPGPDFLNYLGEALVEGRYLTFWLARSQLPAGIIGYCTFLVMQMNMARHPMLPGADRRGANKPGALEQFAPAGRPGLAGCACIASSGSGFCLCSCAKMLSRLKR